MKARGGRAGTGGVRAITARIPLANVVSRTRVTNTEVVCAEADTAANEPTAVTARTRRFFTSLSNDGAREPDGEQQIQRRRPHGSGVC